MFIPVWAVGLGIFAVLLVLIGVIVGLVIIFAGEDGYNEYSLSRFRLIKEVEYYKREFHIIKLLKSELEYKLSLASNHTDQLANENKDLKDKLSSMNQVLADNTSKALMSNSLLSDIYMHDMEVLKKELTNLKRENFILRSDEKESLRAQISQYAERLDYANSRPDNLELLKKLSTSIKYNCSNLGDTRYLTIEFLFKDLYMSQQDKLFEILNELTKIRGEDI